MILVPERGILQHVDFGSHAGRTHVARKGVDPLPHAECVKLGVEAVGVTCLGQQRLGLVRTVLVFCRVLVTAELGGEAGSGEHPRLGAEERLRELRTVNRMRDGAPHPRVFERTVAGTSGGVEIDVADPHGLAGAHRETWHRFDAVHLVGRHIPHEVEIAAQQARDLGGFFRNEALDDLTDTRLTLCASFPVFGVLHKDDRLAGLEALDRIGAGADRFARHALRAGLGIIFVRVDGHRAGDVFQRRGEGRLEMNAHLVLIDLLGRLHPADIGHVEDLVGGINDEVERVDHVVRIEGLPVVERDALTQIELEGELVDPAPRGRKPCPVFEGVGIALDELIPDHSCRKDAFPAGVEIGVRNIERLVPGDGEGVVLLASERRRCQQRHAQHRY